ncbi:PAS domain-containing sensor histidine kinase [Methanoregula sp.]|jgi:PAS domain S-box-containing protein|uniref:sensor histidine kinase n=1 Tax=Methanoregula sp. TaxID=2052170 RepID=UPI003C1604A6
MAEKIIRIFRYSITETDLVRICVITSLAISCMLITAISFSRSFSMINYQLFFIPIVYAAYCYPKRGLFVAGICGISFQAIGYYYSYPDSVAMVGVTMEAILFVLIAVIIAYFIDLIQAGEARYRTVFEYSQLGIVLFDSSSFSIRQINDKFAAMLNYTPDEIAKKSFLDLLLTSREKERFSERIAKDDAASDFETRFASKEGDACWVNLSWSSIDEKTVSCSVMNINARKLAEKLNNDNMMKYRQLTEHSPTGILIIQNGFIRYANPSFITFSGYELSEITGRSLDLFIDPLDRELFISFSTRWNQKMPVSDDEEFRFVAKNGGMRIGALYTTPIRHMDSQATLINIVDISEKQRLEDKIHQDNERRRGIIITVAHELRTPLQPILGYLNLLISDPAGFGIIDDTKKILERCLVSVDRERQIINQMLDLSVLESGKLQLSCSTFSLATLVKKVIDAGGYTTKAELTVDLDESVELTADAGRIFGVMDSIISNAVNYSKPPRKIGIFYRSGVNDKEHRISVQDNGIGIPQIQMSSIFEPFQLADAAVLSRKYDRLGISLSIAKKVVQMHGGDITVESTVNVGSTFTIHLPKELPHDL